MRDNMPNYLNMHNMDPSRVEAAPMRNAECGMRNDGEDAGTKHIESLPGNDSIRPGQGIGTVGFVGHGRDKSLLNVCTAFLSKPEQGKPCADKLLTMSNDKAIKILERIETDIYGRIAIAKAIDALSSPWVKTSDRLPEERDGDHVLVATYDADRRQWIRWVTSRGLVKSCPQIEWWTPIPTLPEAAK